MWDAWGGAVRAYRQRLDRARHRGAHVFVEELTLAGTRAARETLRTTDRRERMWRHHGERTDAVTWASIDVWLSPQFRDGNVERYLPGIR